MTLHSIYTMITHISYPSSPLSYRPTYPDAYSMTHLNFQHASQSQHVHGTYSADSPVFQESPPVIRQSHFPLQKLRVQGDVKNGIGNEEDKDLYVQAMDMN